MRLDETPIEQIHTELKEGTKRGEALVIEHRTPKSTLLKIQDFLASNHQLKIVILVDLNEPSSAEGLKNLDVIEHITKVRHLSIMSNSSTRLDSIDPLQPIELLESFAISGFYNKAISLKAIESQTGIKKLHIEAGLNKKQHQFVESLKDLEKLRISDIDLDQIGSKAALEKLQIDNNLKTEDKLNSVAPNLIHLKLNKCKKILNFDFLTPFKNLQSLSICYNELNAFPLATNSTSSIQNIEILGCKNLSDITALKQYPKLKNLSINNITLLSVDDFSEVFDNKNLENVYLDFKNPEDATKFANISTKKGWSNINRAWNVH